MKNFSWKKFFSKFAKSIMSSDIPDESAEEFYVLEEAKKHALFDKVIKF